MTTYAPEQIRKVLKSEQAEYIEQAIKAARKAPATLEGSLHKTGRTEFIVRSVNEGMQRFADLVRDGWTLDTSILNLYVAPNVPLSFTAICPDHVFETYIPTIAQLAEQAYLKSVEDHNKQAKKLQERQTFIEQEFERREEERKAQLRAELAREYDTSLNPTFDRVDRPRLHAR
ncbi:hypothetical protein BGP82_00345 [Pseudomonas putida]|uniref:Uncharacterized protein n=1 Tax=Pseudomonas putida TaxID=303 RepID=A0A2S3XBP7_PSEPU|nr:hypothetical protein [Pseudomonas putida]POG12949.1 hypothetical protein BGP82_00345 [Pseudomonas putida]